MQGSGEEFLDEVICRVVTEDTSYLGAANETLSEEKSCCIIIDHNGKEGDDLLYINLPEGFVQGNRQRLLEAGELYIAITNALLREDSIVPANSTALELEEIPAPNNSLRHRKAISIGDGYKAIVGTPTLAIVRISTLDNESQYSVSDLFNGIFGDGVTVVNQYAACSFNQLRWLPGRRGKETGVFDVKLPLRSKAYDNDRNKILKSATEKLKSKYRIDSLSRLADKVFMCLPPNSGAFIASAGVNHWRAQFNSGWCLSLTATMHELGHTVGLHHANKNGIPYADETGYMAGGSIRTDWPLKCFNGFYNWQLGFYRSHHTTFNPFREGRKQFELATFVDYGKALPRQPVIINILDTYYLQYNVAKDFNVGTGDKQNMLTVTESLPGSTESRAGIESGGVWQVPNFMNSKRDLIIRVCGKHDGDKRFPQMLHVSIGLDLALCSRISSQDTDPTPSPTLSPTQRRPRKKIPFFVNPSDSSQGDRDTSLNFWKEGEKRKRKSINGEQ